MIHPFLEKLSLQAKISVILLAVIVPTFIVVTIAENKITQPLLEEEVRQVGVSAAKSLAAQLLSQRLLTLPNPEPAIESFLQEFLYALPNIVRMDVIVQDHTNNQLKIIASSVEEIPGTVSFTPQLVESTQSELRTDEQGVRVWEIFVPIEQRARDPRGPRKFLGTVHVSTSTKFVGVITQTLWKTTASAAGLSVVVLFWILSFVLRKTILNERLLRKAEDQNLQLASQLQETERQLMNTEKLAVMGQLTASLAHEIGTPLNAIGGHLQLLEEEIKSVVPPENAHTHSELKSLETRFQIITGQLAKIEQIVKNFLQSTAKPVSQRQLVDLNRLIDQILGIVRPRIENLNVKASLQLNRKMGPLRMVPLDLEQILLNLVNNSLDSLSSKRKSSMQDTLTLKLQTDFEVISGQTWAVVSVYDSGEGISKEDLKNVLKPFFTTKPPGQGTGLGLTICQELVKKQGGELEIDSREGAWTLVKVRLPYSVT